MEVNLPYTDFLLSLWPKSKQMQFSQKQKSWLPVKSENFFIQTIF